MFNYAAKLQTIKDKCTLWAMVKCSAVELWQKFTRASSARAADDTLMEDLD